MRDKILKAADIAKLCGVSEEEVKKLTDEFSKAVPSRDFGRIKVYEEKAAGVISKISGLSKNGLSKDEILSSLGCIPDKKSTKEKVSEKINKNSLSPENKPKRKPGVIEGAEKKVNDVKLKASMTLNRESDRYGALDVKLSKITARVEKIEKDIEQNKKDSDEKYDELKEMIKSLDKKISVSQEWVDYFEKSLDSYKNSQDSLTMNLSEWTNYLDSELEEIKKPFWKRNKKII
ncbi:hypothetical protein L1994_10305 [Methanomicrobium antiquum]|uniref:Uncharacterized protein n=1 Tax=Methanomicrobium antiquum TaxID=487686 RepID=A0AAF0JMG9_9EURY|nr:hypothetical protein [Methanomicrobium antiquum]MDD3976733.1 hypothetical protein [Methanomicrobium sp.]WFN36520.1 hypothetical protein L1994_10305 [Methanomicrobium antiquum]